MAGPGQEVLLDALAEAGHRAQRAVERWAAPQLPARVVERGAAGRVQQVPQRQQQRVGQRQQRAGLLLVQVVVVER